MRRYWLFEFESFYPSGGWNDFIKDYDSAESAMQEKGKALRYGMDSFYHILDSTEGKLVAIGRL